MVSKTEVSSVKNLMPTNVDALREVNNAIYNILVGAQEYKIGSRTLKRADLKELYAIRKELEAGINAEENANSGFLDDTYVAVFPWDR